MLDLKLSISYHDSLSNNGADTVLTDGHGFRCMKEEDSRVMDTLDHDTS